MRSNRHTVLTHVMLYAGFVNVLYSLRLHMQNDLRMNPSRWHMVVLSGSWNRPPAQLQAQICCLIWLQCAC